jgi:membrane protein DedA with SNARE-associated domain
MHQLLVWFHGQTHHLGVWIHDLIHWYVASLGSGGYPLIALLMAIESSIFPLPSELVIPPAVYLARTQGLLSIPGIVIAGAIGSWVGASLMYWAARLAGRPLVVRFGKYVFISQEKIELAERWAARFGDFGVLASRFILVVRHLIGIPAGIVRLSYAKYSAYTLLGSLLWCSALSWVAVEAGKNQALMRGELKTVTIWIVGALIVFGAVYYLLVHRVARKSP